MQQKENPFSNGEILREIKELRELMEKGKDGGRRQLQEAIEEASKIPFARRIQLVKIPTKFTLPTFASIFDGSTCAVQHIKAYNLALLQYEDNEAVLCKYFPASLTGEALKWFDRFSICSIRSLKHLQSLFLGQYISNNILRSGIDKVFSLRRRTNESMRSTTTRWRKMCSEMAGRVDERNLILAFINALFPTDLLYIQIFRMKDRITMAEMREYQEEYIAIEEKQIDMESYPVVVTSEKEGNASLLPRMANVQALGREAKRK
ncbi:uncharacterized protein LOC113280158 [Papaver somniferum]|uniref:uncharacterized protein LOC113280158 n=1 Tax=Papaver somniferum TaxID=3469 RepID=UPI000E7017E5|nr:uncharacterized protein LOC113280158 [Papaver somniferum]